MEIVKEFKDLEIHDTEVPISERIQIILEERDSPLKMDSSNHSLALTG